MRHKIAGRKLGRSSAHRRALFRNLVTDLLNYEKITSTEAKAKEIEIAGGLTEKDRVLAEIKANRDAKVAASLANIKVPGVVIVGGQEGESSQGMTDVLMNLLLLKSTGVVDTTK